jgi:hypothetical protein
MSVHSHPVLFIGSAPPRSANTVFEAISSHVGNLACAVPDGDQSGWVARVFQHHLANPQIETVGSTEFYEGGGKKLPILKVKADVKPTDLKFGPYGFDTVAASSYADFKRLRDAGKFSADKRFQVSLPTPLLCLQLFDHPMTEFLPQAEAAMRVEVENILKVVPANDLAIQWDVCEPVFEEARRRHDEAPLIYKRRPKDQFPTLQQAFDSVARMMSLVPDGVSLGLHLCYGSSGDRHSVEPIDAGLLVEFINELSARVSRRIDWIHFPVPIERDDAAYFAPLKNVKRHPETELFLGLIHHEDGTAGALRRIKAARAVLPTFGVAAECGLKESKLEDFPAMLDLHREVAKLL